MDFQSTVAPDGSRHGLIIINQDTGELWTLYVTGDEIAVAQEVEGWMNYKPSGVRTISTRGHPLLQTAKMIRTCDCCGIDITHNPGILETAADLALDVTLITMRRRRLQNSLLWKALQDACTFINQFSTGPQITQTCPENAVFRCYTTAQQEAAIRGNK